MAASSLGLLLNRPDGHWYVMAGTALTVTNDIGAYAFGRNFGRRKIAPAISPGKTWEGFAGAMVTTLVMAALWTVGTFASGPLHLGRIALRDAHVRPVLTPFVVDAVMVGVFTAGGLLVRSLPFLDPLTEQIRDVLAYTDESTLWALALITAVNGIAEELFFRGAAYAAVPKHPVTVTTIAYTIATMATGNLMLSFAAVLLGVVVGLERRASGGILGPIITHLTWSLSMLVLLPLIFL